MCYLKYFLQHQIVDARQALSNHKLPWHHVTWFLPIRSPVELAQTTARRGRCPWTPALSTCWRPLFLGAARGCTLGISRCPAPRPVLASSPCLGRARSVLWGYNATCRVAVNMRCSNRFYVNYKFQDYRYPMFIFMRHTSASPKSQSNLRLNSWILIVRNINSDHSPLSYQKLGA